MAPRRATALWVTAPTTSTPATSALATRTPARPVVARAVPAVAVPVRAVPAVVVPAVAVPARAVSATAEAVLASTGTTTAPIPAAGLTRPMATRRKAASEALSAPGAPTTEPLAISLLTTALASPIGASRPIMTTSRAAAPATPRTTRSGVAARGVLTTRPAATAPALRIFELVSTRQPDSTAEREPTSALITWPETAGASRLSGPVPVGVMTVDSRPILVSRRPLIRTGTLTSTSALFRRMCRAAGSHTGMTIGPPVLIIRATSTMLVIRTTGRQFPPPRAITSRCGQGKPIPTALSIGVAKPLTPTGAREF